MHNSLRYGAMIRQMQEGERKAAMRIASMWASSCRIRRRWHTCFGGCAFTNSTLVGINNAQVGERLSSDLCKTDIDVVFADEVAQPKTGRTFVESLIEAHERYGLGDLYPRYVIARRRQANNHPPEVAVLEERLAQCEGEGFSPAPLSGGRDRRHHLHLRHHGHAQGDRGHVEEAGRRGLWGSPLC